MPGFTRVEAAMHGSAAAAGLVEESSTQFGHSPAASVWNDTITIPAGSNRVLLDFIGLAPGGTTDDNPAIALDPDGENVALGEMTGSPQHFESDEGVYAHVLLEAAFIAADDYTLRATWGASRQGTRRAVVLSGASQTVYSGGDNEDTITDFTITLIHPSSPTEFAAGSLVYVAMCCEGGTGTTSYTVTGDVTEVYDEDLPVDHFVFAAGTLASATDTVSATFTRGSAATVRKNAIIVVVEPA